MKNKKGFTLMELLGVIIILSIISIIAFPTILNVFDDVKNEISEINKKNIKNAGELLATQILYCETAKDYSIVGANSCTEAKEKLFNGFDYTIDNLKANEYLNKDNNCKGKINIKANRTTYDITINIDKSVTCN